MSGAIDFIRWRNDTFDDIVEETIELGVGPGDAKFIENCKKLWEIYYAEMPIIPLYSAMSFGYTNNYYWTNWPVTGGKILEGNWVETDPSTLYTFPIVAAWCDNPHLLLFNLEATGRGAPTPQPETYMYIWLTGTVSAFTGVDDESYGPFDAGDFARLPEEDANRLITEGKASVVSTAITNVEQSLTSLSETLNNQVNMLTIGLIVEAIAVLVLVLIVMRKK